MPNSALENAWKIVAKPEETEDLKRRRKEDFDFMIVCASKGNMAMYNLLRDKSLDKKP